MESANLSFLYTVEQKRAQKAGKSAKGDQEYRSWINKFSPMVINSGLLQAMTFYSSKDQAKPVYKHVAAHLAEWLGLKDEKGLIRHICELEVADYRRATVEALTYATWLKCFAEAKRQPKNEGKTVE